MTLPIMLMIPRCSCLRRAAKMRLFGGAGEGSRGCFRAQPGGDGAAARTASALRGDQHPCIGIANVLPTTKRKKKEKKKRGKKKEEEKTSSGERGESSICGGGAAVGLWNEDLLWGWAETPPAPEHTVHLCHGCRKERKKPAPSPEKKKIVTSLKIWFRGLQVIRAAGVSSANFLRLMFI